MATYSSKLVTVSWAPGLIINAFVEDSFVEAERNEAGFTQTVGASGEVVRNKIANHTGKITVRLMASSSQNDVLSDYALLDDQVGGQVYPISINDLSSTTLVSGERAYIAKIPKMERGKEIKGVEWVFLVDDITIYNGGITAT